jgi:hypothetical protein
MQGLVAGIQLVALLSDFKNLPLTEEGCQDSIYQMHFLKISETCHQYKKENSPQMVQSEKQAFP